MNSNLGKLLKIGKLLVILLSFNLYSADVQQISVNSSTNYKLIEKFTYKEILESLAADEFENNYFTSLAWSNKTKLLATGFKDGSIIIWDIYVPKLVSKFKYHKDCVTSLSWSADGCMLASSSNDGKIVINDLNNGNSIKLEPISTRLRADTRLYSIALSPDAKLFAVGIGNTAIEIWNVKTKKPVKALCAHDGIVFSLCWSPDGQYLASGTQKGGIFIWDMNQKHSFNKFPGHKDKILSFSWSEDCKQLVSGSSDKTIKIWDIIKKVELNCLRNNKAVVGVTYLEDQDKLISSSADCTMKIWQKS